MGSCRPSILEYGILNSEASGRGGLGQDTSIGMLRRLRRAMLRPRGDRRSVMGSDATGFIGNIPQHYDRGLGPIIFTEYAADISRRAAANRPARGLETAACTRIVTRQLRDGLPDGTRLTATDLNPPMLD